jgi:uncharacterized small protein (DUF1192 family)
LLTDLSEEMTTMRARVAALEEEIAALKAAPGHPSIH